MANKLTLPEMQDLRDLLDKYISSQTPVNKRILWSSVNLVSQHVGISINEKLYETEED